jgi:hypothetical protein
MAINEWHVLHLSILFRLLASSDECTGSSCIALGDQAEAPRLLGYDCAIVRRELRGRNLGCYCAPSLLYHARTHCWKIANVEMGAL